MKLSQYIPFGSPATRTHKRTAPMILALALLVPSCKDGTPLPDGGTDYIVGYIHDITIREPSGGNEISISTSAQIQGADGELISQNQQWPRHNWRYSETFVQLFEGDELFYRGRTRLNLIETGLPFAIPLFSIEEDRLGESIRIAVAVQELDGFAGEDVLRIAQSFGQSVKESDAPTGIRLGAEAIAVVAGAWLDFIETDTLGALDMSFTKEQILDEIDLKEEEKGHFREQRIGVDGHNVTISWSFRRVRVPCDLAIAVRLVSITTPRDPFIFSFSDWDVYIESDAWGGEMWRGTPDQTVLQLPVTEIPDSTTHTYAARPTVFNSLNNALGPFLSLSFGIWDEDDPNADCDLGQLFGFWLTDQLYTELRTNGGILSYPLRARTDEGVDPPYTTVTLEFRLIEGGRGLVIDQQHIVTPAQSPGVYCGNEELSICVQVRNECNMPLAADFDLLVGRKVVKLPFELDGVFYADEEEAEIPGETRARLCFKHTFEITSPLEKVRVQAVGATKDVLITILDCEAGPD